MNGQIKKLSKRIILASTLVILGTASLPACDTGLDPEVFNPEVSTPAGPAAGDAARPAGPTIPAADAQWQEPPQQVPLPRPQLQDIGLQMEHARNLQLHEEDHEGAQSIYQNILDNPKNEGSLRAQALLHLAESLESQGEKDLAITRIENFLEAESQPGKPRQIPKSQEIRKRLREMLLGRDWKPHLEPVPEYADVSRVALELARLYPTKGKVDIFSLAENMRFNEDLFSQAMGDAFELLNKENKAKGIKTDRSISHWGSDWTTIPRVRAKLDNAAAFFLHDPLAHPIPRRYAKYLPLDYDTMEDHLRQGRGLVAVDTSKGLPHILVAGPDNHIIYRTCKAFLAESRLPANGLFVYVP